MSYQQKDNSGAIFKNDDKQQDTHADYRGSAVVDGVDYFVDVWVNTAESGRRYMSLRLKRKERQGQAADQSRGHHQGRSPAPAPRTHGDRPGGPRNRQQPGAGFDDMDDDIPF